VRKRL